MIIKLLNGDLLSIESNECKNDDDIKKKIEEFNPIEYRADCQILINNNENNENNENKNEYLLVMDFSLEHEDAYGASFDSYGYFQNCGVYLLTFKRMLSTSKKADTIWFVHNEIDNTFAYLSNGYNYANQNVNVYPYSSLTELVLDLPHYVVVPRSDISLARLDEKWKSGSYLWKDWKQRYNM